MSNSELLYSWLMQELYRLIKKKKKRVLGILSGTSADAIDCVLTEITGSGLKIKIKVIDFFSYPVRKELKKHILDRSGHKVIKIEDICSLNFLIGNEFAKVVKLSLKKFGLKPQQIDLIGSHGQTIFHKPESLKLFGYSLRSTLQLGDPSVIANLTGITTVADFRKADCAVDGQGAPLVSYMDFVLFTHPQLNRILLNIGGIANMTYVPSGKSRKKEIIAFDSGPGNMLIDGAMMKLFGKAYDRNAATAKKGKHIKELLKYLLAKDKYFKKDFPKTTGREYYGTAFLEDVLKKFKKLDKQDIVRTITDFTAHTIIINVEKLISRGLKADELLVSGGGLKNEIIMMHLNNYLDMKISRLDLEGINAENKEAVLFALLANEAISGERANIPSVTGAKKKVVLGKICVA
ncbi:anhydro-N-acetylmuramic acid kinase AnmK [soil metagenome]